MIDSGAIRLLTYALLQQVKALRCSCGRFAVAEWEMVPKCDCCLIDADIKNADPLHCARWARELNRAVARTAT